ncbi:MAG TPA: hypothetical protein DCO89_00245 [Clostridiales bacterium]|nr:hypothetical protein [Clostridiales bacterium]
MEEQKEERYFRPDVDGGYLYNKSEIDYYKQTQTVDVMANLLLGDFNSKGSYVLTRGIVEQLVKMTKVYLYSFGTTTFCQSASDIAGYGKLDFAVKMRNNTQNGTVTATLQILETIDRANGYYQNTNTASIATYMAPESNTFIVDMLKHFNIISKKDEGLVKRDKVDEPIDLIIARKKFIEQLKNSALPIIDEQNKLLYEKRLKMLAKSGIGKKILEEFSKESYKINGWFVKEGMPGYYRYLNQVLDGIFEVHSAEVLQDVALKASWNKANESFSVAILNAIKSTPQQMMIQEQLAKEQAQNVSNATKAPEKAQKQEEVNKAEAPKSEEVKQNNTQTKSQQNETYVNEKNAKKENDANIKEQTTKQGMNKSSKHIATEHETAIFLKNFEKSSAEEARADEFASKFAKELESEQSL